jgi:hypothetical protein
MLKYPPAASAADATAVDDLFDDGVLPHGACRPATGAGNSYAG